MIFFFSSHYTTPAQCWVQDLARVLYSSRSSWEQGCGGMGQTSRCFIVCSSPHSHVVCPSSLNPHFCIRDLHRPVSVRRRFRLDQVGHASLEPGGSDSLGLNESLCGVVWTCLAQRVSVRVRVLIDNMLYIDDLYMSIIYVISVWARNWKRWDTCLAKLKKVRHMSHHAETRLTKLKHMSHQAEKGDHALATWKEH